MSRSGLKPRPAPTLPAPPAHEPEAPGIALLTIAAALILLVPARFVVDPLGAAGTPAVLIGFGALWLWVLGRIRPQFGLAGGSQPVRVAVLLLALSVVASYAAAFTQPLSAVESRGADRTLLVTASMVGLALLAADGIASQALLERLLKRITVMGTVVAGFGIVQYISGFDPTSVIAIPGLADNDPFFDAIGDRAGFRRVAGTMAHAIEFSALVAMVLPLAIHFARSTEGPRRHLWWVSVGMLGVALPLSVSRTGVLAVGAVFAVLLLGWHNKVRIWALGALAVFVVALRIAFPGLLGTIRFLFTSASTDPSVISRTTDYAYATEFFLERPLLGRGYGTFIPTLYDFLDNQYLVSLIEGGLVGLLALLALYMVGVGLALVARYNAEDPHLKGLALSLAAGLTVPFVTSFTFDFLGFAGVRGLTFLLLGCAGAIYRLVGRP